MRMLLFHRDLNALRTAARDALRRDLDADVELAGSSAQFLKIEAQIWMLRWKSLLFLFGLEHDAASMLEKLTPRRALR